MTGLALFPNVRMLIYPKRIGVWRAEPPDE
jgi:hypothetical protein